MSGGAAAERAEDDAHEGGRQHDGTYSDQAGLHGRLALLQLVRAAARSGVLNRPHMKAKTPTATETLRIVVARLVNSVLMLPSIDAVTSFSLRWNSTSLDHELREVGYRAVLRRRGAATVPSSVP